MGRSNLEENLLVGIFLCDVIDPSQHLQISVVENDVFVSSIIITARFQVLGQSL